MLAIFDIDGTLIRSTHVDDECFTIAMDRVLGLRGFDTNWANYTHSTDDGLILEIAERYGRFAATPRQIDDAKHEFFAQLRRAVDDAPISPCTQIDGVARMLDAVRTRAGWRVGISSGTSPEAAAIKLAAAGLSLAGLPATFSHRCPDTHTPASRADIISRTREKALSMREGSRDAGSVVSSAARSVTPTVYIGDGLWDLRAAKQLSIGFVGVRHDGNESKLRAEGATRIVHHYRDLPAFLALLEEAAA